MDRQAFALSAPARGSFSPASCPTGLASAQNTCDRAPRRAHRSLVAGASLNGASSSEASRRARFVLPSEFVGRSPASRSAGSDQRGVSACPPPAPPPTCAAVETRSLGDEVRKDFPILDQEINGQPLVYLDNAATSQKPNAVLDVLRRYYNEDNSNVHRGVHTLSARATDAYEGARRIIANFINAEDPACVIYTRNATEAINLVAYSWGLTTLKPGDEIVLSVMEHHSNLIPWQIVAQRTGAVIRYGKLAEGGVLDVESVEGLINERTKLVSLAHVSNVLGCFNPVKRIGAAARAVGARMLVDACQSVPHVPVDVQDLACDWLVFSSHKMCGPTGIGALYGRREVLEAMPPFMGGGEMIQDVSLEHFTCNTLPHKFEAGTPAIGEAIGLGAACEYMSGIGMGRIHEYEMELTRYLWKRMGELPFEVELYGPHPDAAGPEGRAALCAFNVKGVHSNDLCTILDQDGVAIRAGHHCTQPLHKELGVSHSARASLHFYNTREDVDRFIKALADAVDFFTSV
eukprot:tig00000383_g24670.t1